MIQKDFVSDHAISRCSWVRGTPCTLLVTKGTTRIVGSSLALDSIQRLERNHANVMALFAVLSEMRNELAGKMLATLDLDGFHRVQAIISEFLNDEGWDEDAKQYRNSQMYLIKPKVVGILDVTRKACEDSLVQIYGEIQQITEISFPDQQKSIAQTRAGKSDNYCRSNSQGVSLIVDCPKAITASTYELMLLNNKNQSSEADTIAIAQQFIESKIEDIRPLCKSAN